MIINIFYEKEVNHYEKILEVKDVFDLIQVNFLRKSNEEYFIGKDESRKCFIIKFIYDKNNNSINYNTEQLYLDSHFSPCSYKFINDANILFYGGYSCRENLTKFIIYDLKNRTIICRIKGKEYDEVLNYVLPKIKNIYKSVKIKYRSKSDLPFGYTDIHPLETKDGEYFIGKNYKSKKYEFKIFKYDI